MEPRWREILGSQTTTARQSLCADKSVREEGREPAVQSRHYARVHSRYEDRGRSECRDTNDELYRAEGLNGDEP